MRKILFYTAILLTVASLLLALVNFSRYKRLIVKQATLIEDQRKDATDLENEFKQLKEKIDAATASQEASKKEALAAKEAQTKAETELANVQQQLAEKEAELSQLKGKDVSTLAPETPKMPPVASDKKSSEKNNMSEKKSSEVDSDAKSKGTASSHLEGKVLAVNATWSFVVISLGEQNGIANNREFLIKRGDQTIAKAKVTSVEPSTSVADIVPSNPGSKIAVQVGDLVVDPVE